MSDRFHAIEKFLKDHGIEYHEGYTDAVFLMTGDLRIKFVGWITIKAVPK